LIGMPQRYSDIVNEKDSPRVMDWSARLMQRPAVKSTLAIPRPGMEALNAQQQSGPPAAAR
ncbi:hypothetical protein ABTD92_22080, partial [Acinetobacter baumannii]